MESSVEEFKERFESLFDFVKFAPLRLGLVEGLFPLVKLSDLILGLFDVVSEVVSVFNEVADVFEGLESYNLLELCLELYEGSGEFVFFSVKLFGEKLFTLLNVRIALHDYTSDRCGPLLLAQRVFDVDLFVVETKFIEELPVLVD